MGIEEQIVLRRRKSRILRRWRLIFLAEGEEALGDEGFFAVGGGVVIAAGFGEVALGDVAFREIVRVKVIFAVAELGGAGVMGVAEVRWDGEGGLGADVVKCGFESGVSAVGLRGGSDVESGVGKGDAGFGHAAELNGVGSGGGDEECAGVGEADVFASADDDAAGEEAGVFAGFKEFGKPVERGVGVAAAHTFDESADGIVMGVSAVGVEECFFLKGMGGDFEGEWSGGVGGWGVGGGCGGGSKFEGSEAFAGVAIGGLGDVEECVGFGAEGDMADAAVGFGERAVEEGEEVVRGEGFEGEEDGAGEKGGGEIEEGVVGGSADEADVAGFDVGQEDVLLGFVEAVDFVEEEDRFFAGGFFAVDGLLEGAADFGGVVLYSAELDEVGVGGLGDEVGEGGFAGAGWAVEDEGGEGAGVEDGVEGLAG